MSRYTRTFDNLEYAYGYDRPLQCYFFEKYDSNLASDKNDIGCVFNISSSFSLQPHPNSPAKRSYSNSELQDLIEWEEKMLGQSIWDEDHKLALAGDLPF